METNDKTREPYVVTAMLDPTCKAAIVNPTTEDVVKCMTRIERRYVGALVDGS